MSPAPFGLLLWPLHRHAWTAWSARQYVPEAVQVGGGLFVGTYRDCRECGARQWSRGIR